MRATSTRSVAASSVAQALSLLDLFSSRDPELGVTEVARRTGLTKARAHRYLVALASAGLVEQNAATRRYRLGLRLLSLSRLVLTRFDVVGVAEPHLQQLALWTELTTTLVVWDGVAPVAVRIVGGRGPVNIGVEVGSRLPLHATAAGKIFLAFGPPGRDLAASARQLDEFTPRTRTSLVEIEREVAEIRARCYVTTDDEYVPGVAAVGVPVFNHNDELAASVTIVGTSVSVQRQIDDHVAAAQRATEAISQALGYAGRWPRGWGGSRTAAPAASGAPSGPWHRAVSRPRR